MAGILNRIRAAFGRQVDAQGNTAESELGHQHRAAAQRAAHDALDAVVLRYLLKSTPKAFAHYALAPNVAESLARCAAVGTVLEGTLFEKLAYALNKSDLQSKLKELGRPVTGDKDALIARVIEADSVWAESIGRDVRLHFLTDEGRHRAEELTRQVAETKQAAIEQCRNLVRLKRYDEAADVGKRFRELYELKDTRGQEFAVCDSRSPAEVARDALAAAPSLLNTFNEVDASTLQEAFVVSSVWGGGGWIQDFMSGSQTKWTDRELQDIARELMFDAKYKSSLVGFRKRGIRYVTISANCGPCPACAKYQGKRIAVEDLPPVQAPDCTGHPRLWVLKPELPTQTGAREG